MVSIDDKNIGFKSVNISNLAKQYTVRQEKLKKFLLSSTTTM